MPTVSTKGVRADITSFFPSRYTPLETVAKALSEAHLIRIRKPYLGKKPKALVAA
jgi:hypothetical protein